MDVPEYLGRQRLSVMDGRLMVESALMVEDILMPQVDQLVAIIGGVVGAVTAVVATSVALLTYRQQQAQLMLAQDVDAVLAQVANQLATAVQKQWHEEEERRRINDPYPLPIRWTNAPEQIVDHWSNILLQGAGSSSSNPLDLHGHLEDVNKIFNRVPSKRIVVLGKAGSGKTILTVRYALGALDRRTGDSPVPVVLGIATWDPKAASLQTWMARKLCDDYPGLSRPAPSGFSLASELVGGGYIFPVLDGFDEIAEELRGPALVALNATAFPFVLTSRPDEFQSAVNSADVLSGAAVVVLADLTVDDLADYLPRTSRRIIRSGQSSTKWDPVLEFLEQYPDKGESRHVKAALSTPLMVGLARAAYSEINDNDPLELLDGNRFPTASLLEDHLLDIFIPTAYRLPVIHSQVNKRNGFSEDNAQRWHGYLAARLDLLGSRDLEWWQLRDAVPLRERLLVASLVSALGAGCLLGVIWKFGVGLGFGFGVGIALVKTGRPPIRVLLRIRGREIGLVSTIAAGIIGGVAGAFLGKAALEITDSTKGLILGPLERATAVSTSNSILTAFIGVAAGFALATVAWIGNRRTAAKSARTARRIPEWLQAPSAACALCVVGGVIGSVALGFEGGLTLGITFGISGGLIIGLEALLDIEKAASPLDLLRTDRRNSIFCGVLLGGALGLAVLIATWSSIGPVKAIALASGCCLMQGIAISLAFTAWGHWIIFVCGWSAFRGSLPFALAEFIDDAHRRGVLRQTGGAYQFRHARLQDRLSGKRGAS
jgi:hypothetical protein